MVSGLRSMKGNLGGWLPQLQTKPSIPNDTLKWAGNLFIGQEEGLRP